MSRRSRKPVSAELQRAAIKLSAWINEHFATKALQTRDPATALELGHRVGGVVVLAENLRTRLRRSRP